MSGWEERRRAEAANAELEARISRSSGDYERRLLAEAYGHVAMRERTRAEAARLTAELKAAYDARQNAKARRLALSDEEVRSLQHPVLPMQLWPSEGH